MRKKEKLSVFTAKAINSTECANTCWDAAPSTTEKRQWRNKTSLLSLTIVASLTPVNDKIT